MIEPYDEMVAMQLQQFKKKNLVSIEQDNIAGKNKDDLIIEGEILRANKILISFW